MGREHGWICDNTMAAKILGTVALQYNLRNMEL